MYKSKLQKPLAAILLTNAIQSCIDTVSHNFKIMNYKKPNKIRMSLLIQAIAELNDNRKEMLA